MSCWALVPIKERTACKTRLNPVLTPRTRLLLVRALLDHVIDTVRNTPGIDHIALVSPERDEVAGDVELLAGPCSGLNAELTWALGKAAARDAHRAVILAADLPLLAPTDVRAMLESNGWMDCRPTGGALLNRIQRGVHHLAGATVAPDRHGHGTNALTLTLPLQFRLAFGTNSFTWHLTAIRSCGNEPTVVRSDGLAFDVDDVSDLRLLRRYPIWATLLAELGPIAAPFNSAPADL